MLIRITRPLRAEIGGLHVDALETGELYRVNVAIATYLIASAHAEAVRKPDGGVM